MKLFLEYLEGFATLLLMFGIFYFIMVFANV